jgi:hypothetical protein
MSFTVTDEAASDTLPGYTLTVVVASPDRPIVEASSDEAAFAVRAGRPR